MTVQLRHCMMNIDVNEEGAQLVIPPNKLAVQSNCPTIISFGPATSMLPVLPLKETLVEALATKLQPADA